MRKIKAIFKKEWDRVTKDKRLLFSVMLLPGLMIFIIYSFMGNAMTSMVDNLDTNLAMVNAPESWVSTLEQNEATVSWKIENIDASEIPSYQASIDNNQWQVLMIFPDDFETLVEAKSKPNIEIYYNQNEMDSTTLYQSIQTTLMQYHVAWVNELYGDTQAFNLTIESKELNEQQQQGQMMAMLLPMLTIMFLFSGAMAIGPESIAGEKERNTIANLLLSPVSRWSIAFGKVISLSVLALLSALSSFIGILLSLPKLMQGNNVSMEIYGVEQYAQILLLLFSTVFVIVGIIAIVSAYAKNLKEASTLIMPIYIITILVGVTSMFGSGTPSEFYWYLIPVYNTVQSLTAVLTFETNTWGVVMITMAANLMICSLLIYVLKLMFEDEKIMFAK